MHILVHCNVIDSIDFIMHVLGCFFHVILLDSCTVKYDICTYVYVKKT